MIINRFNVSLNSLLGALFVSIGDVFGLYLEILKDFVHLYISFHLRPSALLSWSTQCLESKTVDRQDPKLSLDALLRLALLHQKYLRILLTDCASLCVFLVLLEFA